MKCKQAIRLTVLFFSLLLLSSRVTPPSDAAQNRKPNVLFIAVDDLNHWVKHLGRNKQVITPNIDRLARLSGVTSATRTAARSFTTKRKTLTNGRT